LGTRLLGTPLFQIAQAMRVGSGWLYASFVTASIATPQPTRFRVSNSCSNRTIWMAHDVPNSTQAGPQNVKIEPMSSHDFPISDGMASTRYWPKMGCNHLGEKCMLGESGGTGEVCENSIGCAPAVDTKFEATFGIQGEVCDPDHQQYAGCDYLDVSLVDGFTLPFKLDIGGNCLSKFSAEAGSTDTLDCSALSFDNCPQADNLGAAGEDVDLRLIHPESGGIVGCYSPCSRMSFQNWDNLVAKGRERTDPVAAPYCCPTPPESPESCRTGPVGGTSFVDVVHRDCPRVYGYAYDDGVGLMSCQAGTQYTMTFYCPVPDLTPLPDSAQFCQIGDTTSCSNGGLCAGNSCCVDTSTCPSASPGFSGCPSAKTSDCLDPSAPPAPPPAPLPPCEVGDSVMCKGGSMCAGDACCPDFSTCPSASAGFIGSCTSARREDCTRPSPVDVLFIPSLPSEALSKFNRTDFVVMFL